MTFPVRLSLLEEGVDALLEIVAHVAREQQVVGLPEARRIDDAGKRELGGANGQRRMAGDLLGDLECPLLYPIRLDDLVEDTQRLALVGADQSGGEDQLLGSRRPDQAYQAVVVLRRKGVAERAGN